MSPDFRNAVDRVWDAIWSTGVTNPIVVTDLIGTLLMAANHDARWSLCLHAAQSGDSSQLAVALAEVRREYGIDGGSEIESTEFWRSTVAAQRAMELLDPLVDSQAGVDVLGDIYEHVLARLSTAGQFGQFRTPRHIIDFMVEIIKPGEGECVVDPAAGTGGFLVAAGVHREREGVSGTIRGTEIDRTVARIATANLRFHGIRDAQIENADGLRRVAPDADVILANPPFAGTVSDEAASLYEVKTRKTELLFLEAMMNRLKPSGRAAVVIPTSVLTGGTGAARAIRETLVKSHDLEAVIELPSGVFRPYTDVKTAILIWHRRKPDDRIKMIRIDADGFTLDQRRQPTSENDLPAAASLLAGDSTASVANITVSLGDLIGSGFNLNPSRYVAAPRDLTERQGVDSVEVMAELEASLGRIGIGIAAIKKELA